MGRLIHFEIHADDPQRAVAFYQKTFGWDLKSWGGPMEYWLITTGPDGTPGINGGLVRRRGPAPVEGQAVNAFPCTIDVASLEATVQAIESNGGRIALPKMPIPGVGWLAYAKDTEGNIFGIMQADRTAK